MEETDELWPGPRRVPTPLLVGLAVLVALVVFFVAAVRGEWALVSSTPPEAAATPAPPTAARAAPLPSPEATRRAPSATAASVSVTRSSGWVSANPRLVCGMPGLAVDAQGRLADRAAAARPVRTARDRLLTALASSADPIERAASLYLSTRPVAPDGPSAGQKIAAASASEGPADAAAAVGALATLAVSSNSPQVYAWALDACDTQRASACQLLSTDQWARLDSGNAAPWMRRLADAQRERDTGGVVEALHQISLARFNDTRRAGAAGVALRRLPAETPLYVKTRLSTELLGLASGRTAVADADGGPLATACGDVAVRDSNRRQTCAAIAEALTQRGRSLADLATGARLGERVGWPGARVQALGDERNALLQRRRETVQAELDGQGFADCEAMARRQRTLEAFATEGELPAMRRALAASRGEVAARARRDGGDVRSASAGEVATRR